MVIHDEETGSITHFHGSYLRIVDYRLRGSSIFYLCFLPPGLSVGWIGRKGISISMGISPLPLIAFVFGFMKLYSIGLLSPRNLIYWSEVPFGRVICNLLGRLVALLLALLWCFFFLFSCFFYSPPWWMCLLLLLSLFFSNKFPFYLSKKKKRVLQVKEWQILLAKYEPRNTNTDKIVAKTKVMRNDRKQLQIHK